MYRMYCMSRAQDALERRCEATRYPLPPWKGEGRMGVSLNWIPAFAGMTKESSSASGCSSAWYDSMDAGGRAKQEPEPRSDHGCAE
jgi:hypothetical protein